MHDVLDAHAEAAGQIDAGLGGADRVLGHRLAVVRRAIRRLVDVQAEAVAEAVTEVFAVAAGRDQIARRAVDFGAGDARLRDGDAGELRLEHDVINLAHLVRDAAQGDGARHVGAVAALETAEVHRDEVAHLDLPVARHAVGHAGVGAGDDDGVEAVAFRAEPQLAVGELGRDLALGHARADERQHFLQRLIGDRLRGLHIFEFLRLLDLAERHDEVLRGHELEAQDALIGEILLIGQAPVLGAELFNFAVRDELFENPADRVRAVVENDLHESVEGVVRRLDIARVGDVIPLLAGDEHRAVRGVEARGIIAVERVDEQNGVKVGRDDGVLNSL